MGSRLGFVVSLLAACGIHAVILLVPRVAVVAEMPIPTIELDLAKPAEPAAVAPVVGRQVAPTVASTIVPTQPVEPIAQQQLPAAPAPVEAAGSAAAAEEQTEYPAASRATAAGDGAVFAAAAAPAPSVSQSAAQPPTVQHAAPVLIPPHPRTEVLPSYPKSARRAGLEGVVKVAAVVNESGVVTGAEIFASSGHSALDQAALEAVRRALFAPALQEGKPVPCRVVIPIRFQLKPQENAP